MRFINSFDWFRLFLKDRNISRAAQMKKGSGAKRPIPLTPIAASRWVAIAKTITPVQKMEQKIAATKDIRKNHFMPMSVNAMLQQSGWGLTLSVAIHRVSLLAH